MRKLKVWGYSDDNVAFRLNDESADETSAWERAIYFRFENGFYFKIEYTEPGVWEIKVLDEGDGSFKYSHAKGEAASDEDWPNDEDGIPMYSDFINIESPREVWMVMRTEEIPTLTESQVFGDMCFQKMRTKLNCLDDIDSDDQDALIEIIAQTFRDKVEAGR